MVKGVAVELRWLTVQSLVALGTYSFFETQPHFDISTEFQVGIKITESDKR